MSVCYARVLRVCSRNTTPMSANTDGDAPSARAFSASSIRFSRRRTRKNKELTTSHVYPQAIRKKIESELARKRTISTTQIQRKGRGKPPAAKGTVAALKPSPALTVPEGITVSDASQLCAAKRTDCVLVVDEDEGLSGIFTAKDLAYRVYSGLMICTLNITCYIGLCRRDRSSQHAR